MWHGINKTSSFASLFFLGLLQKQKTTVDPCASVDCPSQSVCVLDSERKPHCRCGDICPSDFQPVCGSDGRSYSSQCHLLQEACRSQRQLRILYKGLCETGKVFSSFYKKKKLYSYALFNQIIGGSQSLTVTLRLTRVRLECRLFVIDQIQVYFFSLAKLTGIVGSLIGLSAAPFLLNLIVQHNTWLSFLFLSSSHPPTSWSPSFWFLAKVIIRLPSFWTKSLRLSRYGKCIFFPIISEMKAPCFRRVMRKELDQIFVALQLFVLTKMKTNRRGVLSGTLHAISE